MFGGGDGEGIGVERGMHECGLRVVLGMRCDAIAKGYVRS